MNKFIITGQSDLFRVSLGKQEYLRGIGIRDVRFSSLQHVNVTLVAYTPGAIMTLIHMPDDVILEIVNRNHGFREEHTCDDVIVRMKHCEFHEKWFLDLVPIHATASEQMMLHADMTCELEVLLDR
jgi:hypothetical protein